MNTTYRPEERGAFYEILAFSYLQLPTVESIHKITELLQSAEKIFNDISLTQLLTEAENRSNRIRESAEAVKDIQQEYYDHFFVPTTSTFIPAYASAIGDGSNLISTADKSSKKNKKSYFPLWGHKTHAVLTCYDSVGFKPCTIQAYSIIKDHIIPDYIGYELAFMAYLCASEANSNRLSSNWSDLQKQFLTEHLMEFSFAYCKLSRSKSNAFYRSLSETVHNFVTWDLARE